ncbi:hypothetical protein A0O34_10855 [Chryseobacterium glaciei]|uniref:DUF1648 domain-containing protein n=1 Tax=Chryseobacterium glaciei TaxID=1685010 RepID=A0A172XVX1_9FLAO|nr:hypothetical protein [Chryseobacterium glaciei]ANF50985.1 hypothetical protein A0O34_10855 [Chryseobacterium glaciei]
MIPKSIRYLFSIPFIIIVCYSVYLLSRYNSIPEIIPIHGYGRSTGGSGSKLFLFSPIILNMIILLFIWRIIKNPGKINFTFENKDENYKKETFTVQLVLVIIAIFITVFTTLLLFSDVVYK